MSHYITESGKKINMSLSDSVACCKVTKLFISEGEKNVFCWNNLLSDLTIPEGVLNISCERNNITSLNLPSSVKFLECDLMDGIEQQYKKKMIMTIYQKNYITT